MRLSPLALAAVLAAGPLTAAPAHASILFFQDFSSGIGAEETLSGNLTAAGGVHRARRFLHGP